MFQLHTRAGRRLPAFIHAQAVAFFQRGAQKAADGLFIFNNQNVCHISS
ncbi:hypothetical protein LTSEURB_1095 [Salmonella enterica subsp. enterica serovar Urbana str. R8-2977]|uniref:Uncharacterized protein n=1 Tax=Salmonella enterica subsp. enterica serovar Urbana str. R8-2977 TaxID=913084 RepID=G5RSC0_SALET|nr:hypothetical protein LTSEURB_1095 [Salmonella enterica subsp. enterica serovar Urbana str. R8-2977]